LQPVQQEWARSSDDRARCRSFHCTWQAVEEHTQRDPQVWRAYLRLEVSSYLLFALGALRYSPRMSLDWVSTPPNLPFPSSCRGFYCLSKPLESNDLCEASNCDAHHLLSGSF
jgi:hypothetical protein